MRNTTIAALILFGIFVVAACKNTPSADTNSSIVLDDLTRDKYIKKGKTIAGSTFVIMVNQLQQALAKGGVPNAIQYCNLTAMPLVDSLARVNQATIRRTSLKTRNIKNTPTDFEKTQLDKYHQQKINGIPIQAEVVPIKQNRIAFFAPILVNSFCLQCHGQPGTQIKPENYQLIQQYYPEDKAVGYKNGDLRGMWSVEFDAD